ncbi:MAG TPA: hypothetical protein VHO23_03045 [Candidatus Paceibacterota bacterium]|nr:hypothetical protein [Candidatus Paceibacterota bacterium]
MKHHAYVVYGNIDAGIEAAYAYGEESLGLPRRAHPDIAAFRYESFPVADARRIGTFAAQGPLAGEHKLIIIAASRIFHEAQNALLKIFEEPPARVTLILAVPAEGDLLPTMRSRLMRLPEEAGSRQQAAGRSSAYHAFVGASRDEREKLAAKLLARSKSEKDEEKQAARAEALRIVEDLMRAAYGKHQAPSTKSQIREELALLLGELNRLAPIMHERSAPLKLVFEHLILVTPVDLVG